MFHHIVLMKYSARADTGFFEKVQSFCERIRVAMPNVVRYVHRPNRAARRDGLDWAIVSTFGSSQDHDAYQVSPLHQEMKEYMTPFIERIVVCDVEEMGV